MLAYTNTIETKEQAVANAKWHREQDMLIRGSYGKIEGGKFRGCSVGCTYKPFANTDDGGNLHALSEKVHGIPEELTQLRDTLFERLLDDRYKDWHVDFAEAIPEGADLSLVGYQFKLWLLKDKEHGVYQCANAQGKKAINKVATLLKRKIAGENVRESSWVAARTAAGAAAGAAARAAARTAAGAAAGAAARAAAGAAAEAAARAAARTAAGAAAGAAARAAAWDATWDATWDAQADKLLELMRNAPVKTLTK